MTDFGMSKLMDANPGMTRSKITQCPGTPVFMPPEALRAKPRYSDKLDSFSLGVLIIQVITRSFPMPTDAEIVVEDETSPTGEKILPVPEAERRQRDIEKVPPGHGLLPISLHCLKDRPRDRPSAAELCQSLEQLKSAEAYTAEKKEDKQRRPEQQVRLKEEKDTEIARLKEQMRQLSTEKEQLASEKQREVAELRRQLSSSYTDPAQQENNATVSKPEASIYIQLYRGLHHLCLKPILLWKVDSPLSLRCFLYVWNNLQFYGMSAG